MPAAGDIIRASDVAVQACRVTRAAAQSIPDATLTVVAFDEERFDTDGMHNTVTNNSRITINTAGIYIVGFDGIMQSGSNYTTAFSLLRINGTSEIARGGRQATATNLQQHIPVSTVYQFVVGDYIEVQVFQDNTDASSPANLRNLDKTDQRSPEFYAVRLGS